MMQHEGMSSETRLTMVKATVRIVKSEMLKSVKKHPEHNIEKET